MQLKSLKEYVQNAADYTEIRQHENIMTRIALVNGDITVNTRNVECGISARVRKNGVWGLAAGPEAVDIGRILHSASDNAEKLGRVAARSDCGKWPSKPAIERHDFRTKHEKLPPKAVIERLVEADAYIKDKCNDITSRRMIMFAFDHEKNLATSDGSESYIYLPRIHIYVMLSTERGDSQPVELWNYSNGGMGEFEDFFMNIDSLKGNIDLTYERLQQKKSGVLPKAGEHECILMPDMSGMLAHEAIGHTVEADIVKNGSVAGDNMGKTVASDLVTMVDFAHTVNGQVCDVPVFIDDEGTKAEDVVIIENGVLKNLMHNKETAMEMNAAPLGNARGFGFSDEPLIRMRNTGILPGTSKLEDMIASIEHGYLFDNPANGQADTTGEFMFGVTMGYEIEHGKLGRAILDTTVTGVAFDMLKTVSMVSDDCRWTSNGFCGKKQMMSVSTGGPAIKCRVNVGGQ